jgi:hypothetical protein
VTLRSFDPATGQWSIWYLDTRAPLGPLDPPVRGSFRDGVGTFMPTTASPAGRSGALQLVGVGAGDAALGAGVLRRWRRHLGNQLGDGLPRA